MARQSTTPVTFNRSVRPDEGILLSSGRAGVVMPVCCIPLLAGDSAGGQVELQFELREMPKPLQNGVTVNAQAWFVPKSAHPQFSGRDELLHARSGEAIKTIEGGGKKTRTPPPFFFSFTGGSVNTFANSDFAKSLGLHVPPGSVVNSDWIDAFNLIYNFRLAAHSSKLPLRSYAAENIGLACSLPPAFWPSSRLSSVVPDYERALVVGSFDLDVAAGRLPVSGIGLTGGSTPVSSTAIRQTGGTTATKPALKEGNIANANGLAIATTGTAPAIWPDIYAEMTGQNISITLAELDRARKTQAFARLRASYAGNDATGADNDNTIVAHLMQGISVPEDAFSRPWLLDSKRIPFGMAERFATDAANLEQSVSQGVASLALSLNVPQQDVSGVIIVTVEVLPERIDERMSDEFLLATYPEHLPNALRDSLRTEPVDHVLNRRVDAKHSSPNGLYGYEPMNEKWKRSFTRLGGIFYQAAPGAGFSQNRAAIWQTEIVNPTLSGTHYLAPVPFPHTVFADTLAPAFEVTCRHRVAISGLTQFGDVLAEDNNDYSVVDVL